MNAHAALEAAAIRSADLQDASELTRITRYLSSHDGATLFHRPEWILAVQQGCGQAAHYLVAERPGGEMLGVLPLSEVRSQLFGSALVASGFAVGGGILASDKAAERELAEAALQLARKQRCASIELRGGPAPSGFTVTESVYAGFAREIPSDDAGILSAIPRKQRAEVRKGQGMHLDVTIGRDAKHRRDHFAVYAESVRNLGTPVFPPALFEAMLDRFGDETDILTVSKAGVPVASVLSFYFGGCVYPFWGGGTRKARSLRANELMYFELMRHAAARGCTRFDFGRSKAGTGAYAYKKNWGFEPEPLAYCARTLDGAELRIINPLSPRYRLQVALWRRMPLWLANRLGPMIARGLG
jgi:FemAB-related protein (PEP-CTERM system-associated)